MFKWFTKFFDRNKQKDPLIYTSKGNLPVSSLKLETDWDINPNGGYIKFVERYRSGDGEVVRESAHVYSFAGVTGSGQTGTF